MFIVPRRPKQYNTLSIRAEIHASIGDRESAEVCEGRDLVSARIQLLAGFSVERIERRVSRCCNAQRARVVQSAIGISLCGVLAAAVGENHTVRDTGGSA